MAETEKEMTSVSSEPKIDIDRKRSPNYPSINLEAALARVQAFFESWKNGQVPIASAHTKWQCKPLTAFAGQITSAIKAYGLVETEGTGKVQKIKLSDRALKIARNHPDKVNLIKEAALNPPIYAEIKDKFGVEAPDETIANYLEWEREPAFRAEAIPTVIGKFRETISFAKITTTDIIDSGGNNDVSKTAPDGGGNPLLSLFGMGTKVTPPKEAGLPKNRCNMITDTNTLKEGQVTLQFPTELSQESYELFEDWLKYMIRKAKGFIKTNDTVPPKQE